MNHKVSSIHAASNYQLPAANSKMQNEPNSRIPGVPPPPLSAKRTQSQPRRTCGGPKNRNACRVEAERRRKPNFQQTNIHSTIYNIQSNGPISTYRWRLAGLPVSKYAKRTQSQPPRTCGGPKNRNEPNLPPPLSSRAAGCGAKRSRPKPRDPQNTIAGGDSKQTNPAHTPEMRNEPNGSF